MRVTYKGKARARIEGFGNVEPEEEFEIAEEIGKELIRSGEFESIHMDVQDVQDKKRPRQKKDTE